MQTSQLELFLAYQERNAESFRLIESQCQIRFKKKKSKLKLKKFYRKESSAFELFLLIKK